MVLAYTLEQTFIQTVEIERDTSAVDAFGAAKAAEWSVHTTSSCRLWWWKGSKSTDKSASNQYARPELTFDETGGGLALPLGTDVQVTDRVGLITDENGETVDEGPFRIVSLNAYESHLELTLERP